MTNQVTAETRHLIEAGAFVSESADANGLWKIKVINSGRGSSGTYPPSTLEKYHHAFDDVLSFSNHPVGWDGPESRDFSQIAGQIVGETWVEQDEQGKTAIFANYLPDPEYKDKLERYKGKLGISIYVEGSGYIDDNGDFIVDWFNENDPYRSVDVVLAAGRGGKFLESARKFYAQRSAEQKPSAASAGDSKPKGKTMEKEILDAIEKLNANVEALIAKETQEAQAQADADALAEAKADGAKAFSEAMKLIEGANLLSAQVEELSARALLGEDIAEAVASAKVIAEQAREAAKSEERSVESGRMFESSNADDDYEFKGYGG